MADELITQTESRLNSHEAVCAFRYQQITDSLEKGAKRMDKIEYLIYAVMAVVLLGPGAGAKFFAKLFGL